jgi:hypothetical protein
LTDASTQSCYPNSTERASMPTKHPSGVTSKSVASKAAKLLSNPKTPAAVKSVAASDLRQRVATKKK